MEDSAAAAATGRAWWLAFAAALALYTLTLAPDVLMMDSGEYQVAVHRFPRLDLGERPADLVRVHPVYLASAKLVSLLPVGNPAWRVNFTSALFGAIAVANAALLSLRLTRRPSAALLAGLTLAVGHTLWAFSVIAEVMSMLAALISAELLCWEAYTRNRRTLPLLALAAINGLGVATHLQLGLCTPLHVGLLLRLAARRRVSVGLLAAWAGVWLVGTLPYSGMVAYYLYHTGDIGFVLRSATLGKFGASPRQLQAATLLRGLAAVVLNYPTLLIALAVPGALRLLRSTLVELRVAVLGAAAVQFLFAITYHVPDQYSFFVPFYTVAAVLIAVGAVDLPGRPAWRIALPMLAMLPAPIYAAAAPLMRRMELPIVRRSLPYRDPYDFFIKPWKHGDTGQRRFVTEAFARLPDGAALLTSFTMKFMFEYAQRVDGLRPDVVLLDDPRELIMLIDVAADGSARWRRPVFAADVESSHFPAALRRQCDAQRDGIIWRLAPPRDPAALQRELAPLSSD